MQEVYLKSISFDFGADIEITSLNYTGIELQEGTFIVEWKGLYTGARLNLDSLSLNSINQPLTIA